MAIHGTCTSMQVPATAYCPNCGGRLAPDAAKCIRCGATFTSEDGWRPTVVRPANSSGPTVIGGKTADVYSSSFQLGIVLALGFFGYAFVLLLGQVVYWLRFHEWVEIPLLYLFVEPPTETYIRGRVDPFWLLLTWFQNSWPWLEQPQSWFGFHRIVYGMLSFLHFGVLPAVIGIWVLQTDLFDPRHTGKDESSAKAG
jgi:hypothetical protein